MHYTPVHKCSKHQFTITVYSADLADHAGGHLDLLGIDAVGVGDLVSIEALNLGNFEVNLIEKIQ